MGESPPVLPTAQLRRRRADAIILLRRAESEVLRPGGGDAPTLCPDGNQRQAFNAAILRLARAEYGKPEEMLWIEGGLLSKARASPYLYVLASRSR